MAILELYQQLGKELMQGHEAGNYIELSGHNINSGRIILSALPTEIDHFKKYLLSNEYPLVKREEMEHFHYGKLFNSLMHALAENHFYLQEDPFTSRRIISLSSDCISVIQCKCVSEDLIYLNVFMRSSHYINLLPVDLLFLFGLVPRYIEAANRLAKTFETGWELSLSKITTMQLNLSFGSLHANPVDLHAI